MVGGRSPITWAVGRLVEALRGRLRACFAISMAGGGAIWGGRCDQGGRVGWLLVEEAGRRRDRKSTRLNSSHSDRSRMPSSA